MRRVLKIYPIIEGDGEIRAVPNLLYRILHRHNCHDIHIGNVQNAHGRNNLTRPNGLESFVRRVLREPDCGAVLILIDAERECPVELAQDFSARVAELQPSKTVVIAFAKTMYENWLIASIETLQGKSLPGDRLGIKAGTVAPAEVESEAAAKAWLTDRMPRGRSYKETVDQVAFTQMMDIDIVHQKSRSFRHLCKVVLAAVAAINDGETVIMPTFDGPPFSHADTSGKMARKYHKRR